MFESIVMLGLIAIIVVSIIVSIESIIDMIKGREFVNIFLGLSIVIFMIASVSIMG